MKGGEKMQMVEEGWKIKYEITTDLFSQPATPPDFHRLSGMGCSYGPMYECSCQVSA
jgi:hypothetical protein